MVTGCEVFTPHPQESWHQCIRAKSQKWIFGDFLRFMPVHLYLQTIWTSASFIENHFRCPGCCNFFRVNHNCEVDSGRIEQTDRPRMHPLKSSQNPATPVNFPPDNVCDVQWLSTERISQRRWGYSMASTQTASLGVWSTELGASRGCVSYRVTDETTKSTRCVALETERHVPGAGRVCRPWRARWSTDSCGRSARSRRSVRALSAVGSHCVKIHIEIKN